MSTSASDPTEESIRFLEEHIPDLAGAAFVQAYWQSLADGSSVLTVEDGAIVEVFPDGSRKFIKNISLPIPATPGQKRVIP